ncbi:dnaJ homolog subfamily C member 16 [Nasonia vitripennis]|uniref:DnaJ homolog subfamily C member 16 n=1 Tax=Nasonia vitripennis TaxID=7425 RepID=A0A7M7G571_NASVI|nr:dnaJ homolog subfamily C member 16 [Nasonia vitripennis]
MSCELEMPARALKGAGRSEMEGELCTNEEDSWIPSSRYSQEDIDSPVFYNSSNISDFNSKTKADYKDCATLKVPSKLSNMQKSYVRLTIDLLSTLFTNKKKQSSMELNAQLTGFLLKMSIILISLVFVMQLLPLASASERLGNPYHILGVSRHATLKEIRKAYKLLAKEWHPDKNGHPEAADKFVEITEAYELLSDPERRRKFDNHGITEEGLPGRDRTFRQKREFNMPDPFEELYSGNFQFHYQSRDISLFHEMSISYRAYENIYVSKSYRAPILILFYSDWCFTCLKVEKTWRRLIHELEPLGVNLVTVHAERDSALARKLSVHSLPCLAVTVDGRASIYKESLFSAPKIVEFLRSKLPYRLLYNINKDNVDSFLSGWMDNKIRALIFQNRETPRLRYLLIALHHRDRVVFGFVQTGIRETEEITSKYKVSEDLDTLLLFNENLEKPVASISMQDIPNEMMQNVIGSNKFLILPRLSNQAMLDSICPKDWPRPQKRLCAVLISQNSPEDDLARNKFREAALSAPYSSERVRYTYVFKETQPQFISALSAGEGSPLDPLHHIVIIWRRDSSHINYEWFSAGWTEATTDETQWNETRQSLEKTIQRLLRASEALPYAAEVQELTDEHALGTVDKIIGKAMLAVDYLSDNLTKEQILPLLSVLATLLLIGAVGYGMSYLVKLEEASVQAKYGQFKENSKAVTTQPQLRLHEMRAETYNGLVRLLKPGCRTIVLLVDAQTKLKLLPSFHRAVWPYRKNKTLLFSHLSLERGLEWYKKILTLSLPEPRELNINAKNCVGTVLSLNGHRKYFCMYHAKHPECKKGKGSKRMEKMTKRLARPEDAEAGAFIGFDSSSDSDVSQDEMQSDVLYQDKLLDGLPMWLDRLFEGSTQRYYINYWPDFTAK